jgi:hypothetical protein
VNDSFLDIKIRLLIAYKTLPLAQPIERPMHRILANGLQSITIYFVFFCRRQRRTSSLHFYSCHLSIPKTSLPVAVRSSPTDRDQELVSSEFRNRPFHLGITFSPKPTKLKPLCRLDAVSALHHTGRVAASTISIKSLEIPSWIQI